jgi:hypothetical protein
MSKSKLFVASALALVGVLGVGVARANHADVQWSVTIGTPIGVPIYTEPAPVYPYHQPVPVYQYHQPYPSHYYDPYRRPYRHHYGQPTRWDRDGDGIPNRRDRVYNPRWDRDGDGIPNRRDRDRDGDGIPNWHERDGRHWRGR